jgi:transposase
LALVVLSKAVQRLDAVRAVLAGASVAEVAAAVGVSRVSVHGWLRRYLLSEFERLAAGDRQRAQERLQPWMTAKSVEAEARPVQFPTTVEDHFVDGRNL